MATSNTIPVVIPQPIAAQATSENINVIPNGATGTNRASFQEGFPAITRMPVIENPLPTQVSGLPPKQQDFNGLFNAVSQHNFFAQNGGTYSFNQAVSDAIGGYPKNAVLWYFPENGTPCLVRSLINDNTNNFVNDPTLIDGIHWEKLVNPSSYANVALTNSPYTTNRILEIPQDIKLEFNNGTLTLKAGSKVYVPNGFEADGTTPKFDVVVISGDLTNTTTLNEQVALTVYSNKLAPFLLSNCFSGGIAPTSPIVGTLWYDTANNKMKVYANSIWNERNDCLPIAILTANGSSYASIDQIFNGFGYIGSTVFALPGVKVQIPNGRNEDGTYKSISKTVESVLKADEFTNDSKVLLKLLGDVLVIGKCSVHANNDIRFDEKTGYLVRKDGNDSQKTSVIVADISSSTKISSFTPYNVDSVLNSNLSNLSAAGQAKFDAKADTSQFQVVSALPASPDPDVYYFIPE